MGGKVVFAGDLRREEAGFDTLVLAVPDDAYAPAGELDMALARLAFRQASAGLLAGLGKALHHAEWTVTSDLSEVRGLLLSHGCPSCLAGLDQALAYLAEKPGREVAIGRVWWAAPPD